jgi:nucleotide-binding universal stress UspA family protein
MIRIAHILIPIDFSSASDKALRYGLSLALQFRSRVTLAHIVPSMASLNYAFPTDTFEHEKQAYANARARLPQKVPENDRHRIDVQSIVKVGDVRNELLGLVDEVKADLVVMGTHGRRSFERFFLGSTTEAMLRRVPVPVLTVSRTEQDPEAVEGIEGSEPHPLPIHRVLYAADYSERAKIGLRYAAEFANTFDAELTVLHVMDRLELWGTELLGHMPDDLTRIKEISVETLDELVRPERERYLKIKTVITEGTPYRDIVRFAETHNMDFLMLNIQSKSALERAMLGATAERVIRSSRIPVLSIPAIPEPLRTV